MRGKKIVNDQREKHQMIVADVYGDIRLVQTRMPNVTGQLALKIAERLALCTAQPSGKCDESGRMIYEVIPPEKVARRSVEIAKHLMCELEEGGMMIDVPFSEEKEGAE